jgi:hypothetical protein
MNRWILLLICCLKASVAMGAETTIHPENSFAWSGNAGWLNWRGNVTDGAQVGEFVCSGHVYSANTGWIHLGSGLPANGVSYLNNSSSDFGVNRDGLGNLSGLAYGANIGWLLFTNRTSTGASFDGPRVDPLTGRFSGSVYGSNIGWISLSNAVAHVQTTAIAAGEDSDGDGIPDAWELGHAGNLTRLSAVTDVDTDGATDLQEYLADTDPLDPADRLEVLDLMRPPGENFVRLDWSTRPTRTYFIQMREDLAPGLSWLDSGLGLIVPDGPVTSRTLPIPPLIRYFRIEARRPLAP